MSTDRAATIADELAESPVHVEPGALPEERVETLTELVDGSPVPIYVVYVSMDYEDEFGGDAGQLLALVHEKLGEPGVYASVDWNDYLTVREYDVASQSGARSVAQEESGAGAKLERFVELVATGTGDEVHQEMREERTETESSSDTEALLGLSVATVGFILVAAAILALAHRARIRRGSQRVATAFSVPAHVREAVRGARMDAVDEQARTAILELGQRLDSVDVPASGRPLAEYRSALDAYDAARRTQEGSAGFADTVGALVLAEMGEAHLRRAVGNESLRRQPLPTPCFFNPLHGAAAKNVALPGERSGSGDVASTGTLVAACTICAEQVGDGVEPDILQVAVDGQDVPYYESGFEPWASTGYGALRSNLVERVLAGM
ncbi:hypothetical protein EF847_18665 [Actinobacteria bacterium YIM 96077]|uniref:Uncharacterized protein n=1 Tax=Phytoactinopolyspora halophila TaxID=1981511 RepID=A0A329QI16_9ACTN|nr:hypothetical protein [Phytoactinopolyspora halophila]AYY14413.1 hypothetical protein EF847_18665 [Actinobacteria bacterium YIM 96077]RAW11866.1 hypothetical protein DPM12_15455 [Phytoactinopolyspora halophila]